MGSIMGMRAELLGLKLEVRHVPWGSGFHFTFMCFGSDDATVVYSIHRDRERYIMLLSLGENGMRSYIFFICFLYLHSNKICEPIWCRYHYPVILPIRNGNIKMVEPRY